MPTVRSRLRAENGSALMISFFILLAVLAFTGASFEAAVILSNATNKQTNAQQAFQAADAGIDQAVHRIAMLNPATTACVLTSSGTATTQTPAAGSTWCSSNTNEIIGSNATFTYSTSTVGTNSSCAGSPTANAATSDRCIVATGTANGVQRRLEARVTTRGGLNDQPLSDGDIKAADSVKVEHHATINGAILVNNKLEISHDSTVTGTVTVGSKAKVGGGFSNYTRDQYNPTIVTASRPNFGTTAIPYSASNQSGNNNSTISTSYYTAGTVNASGVPGTRSLYVPKNKQVTLAPGVYNFCSIKLDGRGILNIAGTGANPVKVYLDSPDRPGSNCPKNTGTLTAAGKSVFVNPSLDPTGFLFFAYGSNTKKKRSRLQIPLGKNGTLAVIIDAPYSEVRFGDNKNTLIGGIIANRVVIKDSMRFVSDARVRSWTTSTVVQSFRIAWKQCDSTITSPATPTTGC